MVRLASLISALALLLNACGGSGDGSELSRLESEVDSTMVNLPYSFKFLDEYSTADYAVFRVDAGGSVDVAFGGKSRGDECPKPPQLPAAHRRRSKPFAAAGPEPLICLEHDAWRPRGSNAAAIARLRAVNLVANALCEEVYEGYESFACFD